MENKIAEQPLKERRKVSADLDRNLIDLIDEIAQLTKSTRTIVINALLYKGMPQLFEEIRLSWVAILNGGKLDEKDKVKIKRLLHGLEKIQKKFKNSFYK